VALVGGSGGSFYGVSLKQLCCLFASFVMNTGMRCLSFMSLIFLICILDSLLCFFLSQRFLSTSSGVVEMFHVM
jgi:hypothetical protein